MNIDNESFKQPVFGDNYLSGICNPIPNSGIIGPVEFEWVFLQGGTMKVLPIFYRLMEGIRKTRNQRFGKSKI